LTDIGIGDADEISAGEFRKDAGVVASHDAGAHDADANRLVQLCSSVPPRHWSNCVICLNDSASIMPRRCLATAIIVFQTRFDSEHYTTTAPIKAPAAGCRAAHFNAPERAFAAARLLPIRSAKLPARRLCERTGRRRRCRCGPQRGDVDRPVAIFIAYSLARSRLPCRSWLIRQPP